MPALRSRQSCRIIPSSKETTQFTVRDLLIGKSKATLLPHLLRGAPNQAESGARQTAADADALDAKRRQLGHGQRCSG